MLAPSPGSAMQVNGLATDGPGKGGGTKSAADGGGAADSGTQLIGAYFRYKQGGFMFSGYLATASGDADTDNNGTLEFSGGSTAAQLHLIVPIGGGNLKFDLETVANDLEPALNGGVTEEEQTFTGVLLELGGLRAGFNQGVQEIGAAETTQTNLSAHYRIAITENFWVGPEYQLQTIEVPSGAPGTDDEEITSLAFLLATKF